MNGLNTKKEFAKYLLPSMLTMMLMAVYTFTDTFVVGQKLGSVALGAMGVCTPVLTITYAFGFLFGMGGASIFAMFCGQKRFDLARKIFFNSVLLVLGTGIIAAVLLNIFATPFTFFLGADTENIVFVMPYLRVMLTYIPGFMMDILMMCYMKNEGHPTIAMIATVVGTALNVVLDFVFVFGFEWGMFGAAFATALCSGIGCAINIGFAYAKKMNIRFSLIKPEMDFVKRIISNGFSILVLEASSGIVTFVFIHYTARLYGNVGSAIYTIIMNWSLIFTNLTMGVAQAMQPLVSRSYGQGNIEEMTIYRKYSLLIVCDCE